MSDLWTVEFQCDKHMDCVFFPKLLTVRSAELWREWSLGEVRCPNSTQQNSVAPPHPSIRVDSTSCVWCQVLKSDQAGGFGWLALLL